MKKLQTSLLFGFIFFFLSAYFNLALSQNQREDRAAEVDSLHNLYKLESRLNPEKGKEHLDQALAISIETDYLNGIAYTYRFLGDYFSLRGDLNKAENHLKNAQTIFLKRKDLSGLSSVVNGLGNLEIRRGNFELSLKHFLQGVRINEIQGNLSSQAKAHQNAGGVLVYLGNFDDALYHIEKSIELKTAINDSVSIISSYNAMSTVHSGKGNHREALDIQHVVLKLAGQINNKHEVANSLNNIGVEHYYLNDIDSSRFYYEKALEHYIELDETLECGLTYINLGGVELELKNYSLARDYFAKGLELSNEVNAMRNIPAAYKGLSDANYLLGNYEEANSWLEKFYSIQDSLSGERVKVNINELQEGYETEQKDRKIADLEVKKVKALATSEQRKFLLIIVGIIAFTAILLIIFYLGRKKARAHKKIAELEQKALKTQIDPDSISDNLTLIREMYSNGNKELANNYLGDFGRLLRRILESSDKDKIKLIEEIKTLQLFLDLEKYKSNNSLEYTLDIDEKVDKYGIQISPLIIHPFVENVIRNFSLSTNRLRKIQIKISLSNNANKLICALNCDGMDRFYDQKYKSDMFSNGHITNLGAKIFIPERSQENLIGIKIPLS